MSGDFQEKLQSAISSADKNIAEKRAREAAQERRRLQEEQNALQRQQQHELQNARILNRQPSEFKKMAELLINEGLPPLFRATHEYAPSTPIWNRVEVFLPSLLAVLLEPKPIQEDKAVWVVTDIPKVKVHNQYSERGNEYSRYWHEGACLDRDGALWHYRTSQTSEEAPLSYRRTLMLGVMGDSMKLAGCDEHDVIGPWRQAILDSIEINRREQ